MFQKLKIITLSLFVLSAQGSLAALADARTVTCDHELGARPCDLGDRAQRAAARRERCAEDPRVLLNQVSHSTCVGAELFFRETFDGNGRTCGSCHPAQNNYTLDAPFIATLPDDDPLFIAEHNEALRELEKPALLRGFGLIVVNPDGFEAPTSKYVVRSVSHMLGLATSIVAPDFMPDSTTHARDGTRLPPLDRLGWSGDGAPGSGQLRDFADGAITQHMTRSLQRVEGVDFGFPDDLERDAIAEFSRTLGRMNEVDMSAVHLNDPGAERGRDTFMAGRGRECAARCHSNAGANVLQADIEGNVVGGLANFTFDVGTPMARLPEVDALGVPRDGGHGQKPIDIDGDGTPDGFGNGAMNIPPLIEAADTAPMFHSHAFATLEDAIDFYATDGFARSTVARLNGFIDGRLPGDPMEITKTDSAEMGRFLRVANAALNCQMSNYRLRALLEIRDRFGEAHSHVQDGLLQLAGVELEDAVAVLSASSELHPCEQAQLTTAIAELDAARGECSPESRARIESALQAIEHAMRAFGTGLAMQIGPGTLMF